MSQQQRVREKQDPLEAHVILGLGLSLASVVLLTLVTFSLPFIRSIYYLRAATPDDLFLGGFGYCSSSQGCTAPVVGYETDGEVVGWLTKMHILFPLAAILMLFALLALIMSVVQIGKMWNPIYYRTAALLGALLSILGTIFALINHVQARNRYNARGIAAYYGSGLWMALAGSMAALLAVAIGGPRITARYLYRADHRVAYNV